MKKLFSLVLCVIILAMSFSYSCVYASPYNYGDFIGEWHKVDPDALNGDVILNILDVKDNNRICFSIDGDEIREEYIYNNQVKWNEQWYDGEMGLTLTFFDDYIHLQYSRYSAEWYTEIIFVPSEIKQSANDDKLPEANINYDTTDNSISSSASSKQVDYVSLFGELINGRKDYNTNLENLLMKEYDVCDTAFLKDCYLVDMNNDSIPELLCVFCEEWGPDEYAVLVEYDNGFKVGAEIPFNYNSGSAGSEFYRILKANGNFYYEKYYSVRQNYDDPNGWVARDEIILNTNGEEKVIYSATSNYGINQVNGQQVEEIDYEYVHNNFEIVVDGYNYGASWSGYEPKFGKDYDKFWDNNVITVILNGKKIIFDQPPIIVDGRTLVPLRAIFEAMGATVEWNESTKTATGYGKLGYNVTVTEGSDTAYIDGFPYRLDVPVKNYNGRLLAPARFVAEAFGGYVSWDAETKTVKIQSLSADVSDNRSYDENARYSTCYDAAMTHGRLVYIADGYKTIFLRSGYIDKTGNQYRFVNSQKIGDQRYYFDSSNNLVADYDLAKRLDFVYNVNNNDYEARSEHWTEKANVEDEMNSLKQSFSKAVALLEEGAASLELGYSAYDVGKIFFNQMVIGTIYPPYGKEKLKDVPADFAETTTNLTFDGILLFGLINSKNDFNEYCDTITKTYNKYGYGYITSLEDAEQYISAVSGQHLMIGNAEAFAMYLKETYPNMTVTDVLKDLGKEIVTGVTDVFVDKIKFKDDFVLGKKLKKMYTAETEIITYLEGINTGGSIAIAKQGTAAFYEAHNIISRLDTFEKTNSKYIELIR